VEPYDAVILVDALPRGGSPGTLYTIEPDLSSLGTATPGELNVETHGMNPMKVLAMVRALGGQPNRLYVIGCEPERLSDAEDSERMGLSPPVALAVDEAVAMIHSLIEKISAKQQAAATL
jgi:hydrogenase maturation protease